MATYARPRSYDAPEQRTRCYVRGQKAVTGPLRFVIQWILERLVIHLSAPLAERDEQHNTCRRRRHMQSLYPPPERGAHTIWLNIHQSNA